MCEQAKNALNQKEYEYHSFPELSYYAWKSNQSGKTEETTTTTVDSNIKETNYWIYSPGDNASMWDEFYKSGIMGIGWDAVSYTHLSTGFTVIDVNYDKAVPDFIYYALTKQEVTEQLQAIAEQSVSAYPSLKPSDIENLEFMLPDKKTQERIVAILRSIDEKIKENNAINNNLVA